MKKKVVAALKELKKQLKNVWIEDFHKQNMLAYFDLISWTESKIESRPFAEVVKEKAKTATG